MTVASTATARWAVSVRTHGEVLTAGVSAGDLELVLLGVPTGFTSAEIEGWLRDLAGVARETSGGDERVRAIPPLLHHTLTGLLFSQSELWSHTGAPGPCSLAFVDSPHGAAFGWVGEARVQVLLDGEPIEPAYVRVRDEGGREAFGVLLPAATHVLATFEHWPNGKPEGAAPIAVEAEWSIAGSERVALTDDTPVPQSLATPEAPAEAAAALPSHAADLPESLPTQQPSLMQPALASEAPELAQEPAALLTSETSAQPSEPSALTSAWEPVAPASEPFNEAPARPHPVARWLNRLMSWGRKPEPDALAEASVPFEPVLPHAEVAPESLPVSEYDALLSETTPPEATPSEQTALAFATPIAAGPQVFEVAVPTLVVPPLAPEPPAPTSVPSVAAPGGLAPAGLAEIFGEPSSPHAGPPPLPVAPIAPPLPIAPPGSSVPVAPSVPSIPSAPHAEIARAMNEADAATLPTIAPWVPVAPNAQRPPVEIIREPVGAHETFAIPRVPVRPGPPSAPPVLRIDAPTAPSDAQLVPAPLAPVAPPEALANEPLAAPPVLRVPEPPPSAPPVLQLPPSAPPQLAPLAQASAALDELPWAIDRALPRREATALDGAPPRVGTIARPAWPTPEELAKPAPWFLRPWALGSLIVLLFAGGWALGQMQGNDKDQPSPLARFARALGIGGARFTAVIDSDPQGAWIAIDGKDVARRTPAKLELSPGEHVVTLSLPELGSAKFPVKGSANEAVTLDGALSGDLEIYASDSGIPIAVAVDGKSQGYAPVKLEAIAPGLHEVQFSGPGMPAWAQTIQVGVHRTAQLVAHPMSAPATGVIQVQSLLNDDQGSAPLAGAQVFVDGEQRGATPLSLDLPRGPHSLRATWHGEVAPVQVIDLPGGNQRFATFNFGLDADAPRVVLLQAPRVIPSEQATMISAQLTSLKPNEVREAWLHVRSPEGLWRRYAMSPVGGPEGTVVVTVFPVTAFDAQGQTRWYVSAMTPQGDEMFSEIQSASLGTARAARAAAAAARAEKAAKEPAPKH